MVQEKTFGQFFPNVNLDVFSDFPQKIWEIMYINDKIPKARVEKTGIKPAPGSLNVPNPSSTDW